MLNLRKIAVTGGIACGKSTVCALFKKLGAFVVESDEIVHKLLANNKVLHQKIVKLLGPDVVVKNKISRSRIAKVVFNDPKKLQHLEKLIHPMVFDEIELLCEKARASHFPLFVAEVPLLFETKSENLFDMVITVAASEKTCRERLKKSSVDDYQKRMERHLSIKEKKRRADIVIVNEGSLKDLKNIVNHLFDALSIKSFQGSKKGKSNE
jgi:dephospho-CoA kinase